MSEIRDTARKVLNGALPANKIITSNGNTAAQYTEMAGLTHKQLTDNWETGGIMTGCNGVTGWYGRKLGSKVNLGGFDLKGIVSKAGKSDAWIPSTPDNRPAYGDILRHMSFHVDIALDFSGPVLERAAGGQGGPRAGCDIIKRVSGPYSPGKLMGWIDIDVFFAPPANVDPALAWLYGWWKVSDGNIYYYWFGPGGDVQYIETKPAPNAPASTHPGNKGRYTYDGAATLIIIWNPRGGASTKETFSNAFPNARTMNATSNRFLPLEATKL